ncbi:flagellar brake domain-containing protein [Bacillus sp. BRMEA1]|uniref:flagellar brake protein n=1 Tax=Neobacillus endophyticus TaxID=2738405 RepID=UPI0015648C28|nr:flagellar brake domain-containing protein [Neobacillus endophyticus]NRD79399.1 flagellar brake domain-containing protein [Neobacillus endophyticus]
MYPKVGQNIQFKINNRDETWKSVVADIQDEEIFITFPTDRTILGSLLTGSPIEIIYASGESKYEFVTEILGKKIENILLVKIRKPKEEEIKKIQERENFRVNASLRLALKETKLSTVNISAGGLLCSCDMVEEFTIGEEVLGMVFVPDNSNDETTSVSFKGEIIRVDVLKEIGKKNIAVKFNSIETKDQQKILQYCFEKQRQNRSKIR